MRIHAIETGKVRIKRSQLVGQGIGLRRRAAPIFDRDWADWVPTYAFAIEHRDGVVVVDSGANEGLTRLPRWHPYFRFAVNFDVSRENEIGPQLKRLGIGPKDVKTVVLTHMHIDHDGGVADLPFSEILATPDELQAAKGLRGRIMGYLPQRWPRGFDPQPLTFENVPCGPFARSRRLTADGAIRVVPTPGHTPWHVSVVVEDEDATVFLAGDAAYTEAALRDEVVDGICVSEEVTRESLAKIRALAAQRPLVFLPTHDPETAARLAASTAFVADRNA